MCYNLATGLLDGLEFLKEDTNPMSKALIKQELEKAKKGEADVISPSTKEALDKVLSDIESLQTSFQKAMDAQTNKIDAQTNKIDAQTNKIDAQTNKIDGLDVRLSRVEESIGIKKPVGGDPDPKKEKKADSTDGVSDSAKKDTTKKASEKSETAIGGGTFKAYAMVECQVKQLLSSEEMRKTFAK